MCLSQKSHGIHIERVCSAHGTDEKYIQNLLETLKGRDHIGDIGVDGRILLKWSLQGAWAEFIALRIRTSGGIL
jgi:hypothetical protein